MKKPLFTLFVFIAIMLSLAGTNGYSQYTVSGQVVDVATAPITRARITLFNAAQTYFQEERTDASGSYNFSNVPAGAYTIGFEKISKEYYEQAINVVVNITVNRTLLPETNPGIWNIVKQSPEPLGGTNLGVLQPDGKLFFCHNTKDPFIFDPTINNTLSVPGSPTVLGCVGLSQQPDGKLWFIGGALVEVYGPGSRKIKSFDPVTSAWQPQPDMLDYRWYPSTINLPNGKVLTAGGGGINNPIRTNTSELYNPATGTSVYTDTIAIGNEVSPIVVLYNGKVLMTHRPPQLFDPATNQWEPAGSFVQSPRMPNGDHSDLELVLMPDGEAIAIGYQTFTPGVYGTFVERYNPITNTWSLGTSLLPIRERAKTVLLPDKNILVIGGTKVNSSDTTAVNQWGSLNLCDMYKPATDSWRRLSRLAYKREYHCNTILVPDGRIIAVGGEGQPGNEPPFSVVEAFRPPYLFRGVRPEIINLSQTSLARGANIDFDFLKTDSITEVVLMSNAVVTHFMNSGNNRYLSLNYTQTGNHITATLPTDSIALLPGYYMLFAMVDDIPSVAKIIKVGNQSTTLPIKLITFTGKAQGNKNVLNWTTATEINSSHFSIQRGSTTNNFENIATIKAAGNSTHAVSYSYADAQPSNSTSYYRLQLTDMDGKTSLSRVISIKRAGTNSITIYPNPATTVITVSTSNRNTPDQIDILNGEGKSLIRSKNRNIINISTLPAGNYFIRVRQGDETFTDSFIKK